MNEWAGMGWVSWAWFCVLGVDWIGIVFVDRLVDWSIGHA